MDSKFPPALMLTQMRQKTSRSGAAYLEGRLGLAKVLLLQSNKRDEDGNAIWNLCLQEMPRDDARPAASKPKPSIFSTTKPAPAEAKEAKEAKTFDFNDNIDDLWPSGRA
jgi:hypothetical protein